MAERRVYKYPLEVADSQLIEMPIGAELLTVQTQDGVPTLWALVELSEWRHATERREIITHGTGHRVSDRAGKYIGTYQLDGGSLVFHVFDEAA